MKVHIKPCGIDNTCRKNFKENEISEDQNKKGYQT